MRQRRKLRGHLDMRQRALRPGEITERCHGRCEPRPSGAPSTTTSLARTSAPGLPSLMTTSREVLVHDVSPAAAGLVAPRNTASYRSFSIIQRMKPRARGGYRFSLVGATPFGGVPDDDHRAFGPVDAVLTD